MTVGIVLMTVAIGWRLREFWLPLLPVWDETLKAWTGEWGDTAQALESVIALFVLIGGGVVAWLGLRKEDEAGFSDRPGKEINQSIVDLLKPNAPIHPVSVEELARRLGNSGRIPYVERGVTDNHTLMGTNRLAIVGAMKSGKTREAIELMSRTQQRGLIVSIYEPTSSLDLIDLDILKEVVSRQIGRDPLLFFVDELGLRQGDDNLARLSMCIETIRTFRPDARFLVTLQEERLTERLRIWLNANNFEFVTLGRLTDSERSLLVERGRKTLGVAFSNEAAQILAESKSVTKPWDVVSVLQDAPQTTSGAPEIDAPQVQNLLSQSQDAIWKRQRQEVIDTLPVAGTLLEAISTFLSAGVTPRTGTVRYYADYLLMSKKMGKRKTRQTLLDAASTRWKRFDIVATEEIYTIPEPRLLPLIIETEQARKRLNAFLEVYRPGFDTLMLITLLRPLEWIANLRLPSIPRWVVPELWQRRLYRAVDRWALGKDINKFNPVRWILLGLSNSGLTWGADKALLSQELGSTKTRAAYFSSHAFLAKSANHFDEGEYSAALIEINRAIALAPEYAMAYFRRASIFLQIGRYTEALADINWAITNDPEDGNYVHIRGSIYLKMERFEEALADFTRAIKLALDNDWSHYSRGAVYRLMGCYEKALTDINRAIDLSRENNKYFDLRGLIYLETEQYHKAVADLTKSIALRNDVPQTYEHRAYANWHMNRHLDALADVNRAIELGIEKADYINLKGLIYRDIDQYEKALDNFTQAISLLPDDSSAYENRAGVHWKMERYNEALADFSRSIVLKPDGHYAYNSRAIIYWQMKRYDEALTEINRAIELATTKIEYVNLRGLIYLDMEQYQEAFDDFARIIALKSDYHWAYRHRARAYCQMKRHDEALADINRALEFDGEDALHLNQRGLIYWGMGQHEKANTDFTQAIYFEPDNSGIFENRANVNRQMKRFDEALKDINRAIDLDPENVTHVYHRGAIYQEMKQYQEAIIDFTSVIALKPDDVHAYSNRSYAYWRLRRYTEALEDITNAIELDVENVGNVIGRARIYLNLGQFEQSLTDFTKAIAEKPDADSIYAERANVYRLMKYYNQALADINRAIELSPDNPSHLNRRNIIYQDIAQDGECVTYIEKRELRE